MLTCFSHLSPSSQVHNPDPMRALCGVLDDQLLGPDAKAFSFCMCNPPFFDTVPAPSRTTRRSAPRTENTAADGEQITPVWLLTCIFWYR
eukprot:m.123488 g.123488  ORF g.123488 m.123488 type:complete len:90 (+) comp14623_c1_seq5:34-303(+)